MTRDGAPASQSEERARTMVRLLWRFEVMRRAQEQTEELRSADGRLLWLLTGGRPALTLKQIAAELELEQSTANRQVNGALRAGLVHRFREPGTHAWLFEPTDEGLELYERSLRCHVARVEQALETVPEADREALLAAFSTFIDAYAAHHA